VLARHCDAAVADLQLAVWLWDEHRPAMDGADLTARAMQKSLQKSLQDGYASVEAAALYVLSLAREPRPEGPRWHEELIVQVATPGAARPGFATELEADLHELRRFRHIAMHAYAAFEVARAEPSVRAARRVAAGLTAATQAFGRNFGLLPAN
jgi:hypothetical protein